MSKDKTTKNDDGSTTVVREMEEPVSKPFLETDSIPEMVARSLAAATGCKVPVDAGVVCRDPMDEMRHREEDAAMDKLEAKINDPYPDSIPFDEFDKEPYADSVEPDTYEVTTTSVDEAGAVTTTSVNVEVGGSVVNVPSVWVGTMPDSEIIKQLSAQVSCLKAHLNSKGYGQSAIRRILAGEVVR